MNPRAVLAMAFVIAFPSSFGFEDFCGLACGNLNTVCKRRKEKCSLSTQCRQVQQYKSLTWTERKSILHWHNKYRSQMAMGQVQRVQKTVSNMQVLSYSEELEYIAQCYANNCEYVHDMCRMTKSHPRVGQNLFIGFEGEIIFERATFTWYSQNRHANIQYLMKFSGPTINLFGAFSQLVWAETIWVGCGRVALVDRQWLVCNYAPAGNELGKSIVKLGEVCSDCSRSCNLSYPGLCGRVKPTERFAPPYDLRSPHLHICAFMLAFCVMVHICM